MDSGRSRREFLRKAAGGLGAPIIISLSLAGLNNRAWAQQVYQPALLGFEQQGADSFRLTFNQAMDTSASCLTVREYPAAGCGGAPAVYAGVGFDPGFDQWLSGDRVFIFGGWPPDAATRALSLVLNTGDCLGGQYFASAQGVPLAAHTLSPCLDLSGTPRLSPPGGSGRKAGYR